jgi:hypothetical protein
MTSIKECANLSREDTKKEIILRRELVATMVGSLYPQIVMDEIRHLESLYNSSKM